uniref:PPM-type phosphatase domain-containing protein n=1 Tax=Ignisphaera aggregans TaxID=334771 RepID=A0A7C5Z0S8_9CREN
MFRIKFSTSSLCCESDSGSIALNFAGFVDDRNYIFNGIVFPKLPRNFGFVIESLFDFLQGKLSNVNDFSMVCQLNNKFLILGEDLSVDKVISRKGSILNIYLTGSTTYVGGIYLGINNIISSIIGYADSLKGFRANKEVNDDSILVLGMDYCYGDNVKKIILGVVADGVSSLGKGFFASSEAIKIFVAKVLQHVYLEQGLTLEDLSRTFRETAKHIYELNLANNKATATTFTAFVYPVQGKACIVHVGDTRAYIFSRSKLMLLTEDHKIPGTNVLTKAIGVEIVEPMYRVINFKPGDTILLISDGIYSVIGEDELTKLLLKIRNPYDVVKTVLKIASDRKVSDDASIGIIKKLF